MLQISSHIQFRKGLKHCADSKAITHINMEENSQFPSSRHLRNGHPNKNIPRIVHRALIFDIVLESFSTIRTGQLAEIQNNADVKINSVTIFNHTDASNKALIFSALEI
jgi:hypothetical protein